jgi:phage shock protein E
MHKKITLPLVLAVLFVGAAGCDESRSPEMVRPANASPAAAATARSARRVSGSEARSLVAGGALLLDVRTPGEFSQDAIAGAVNVPYDQIEARASELGAKDRQIVVYCRTGHRAGIAARTLVKLGYSAVYDLGPRTAW